MIKTHYHWLNVQYWIFTELVTYDKDVYSRCHCGSSLSLSSCVERDIIQLYISIYKFISILSLLIWLMLCLLLSGVSTNPPQLERDSCSWVTHHQASRSSSHSNQSKFRA